MTRARVAQATEERRTQQLVNYWFHRGSAVSRVFACVGFTGCASVCVSNRNHHEILKINRWRSDGRDESECPLGNGVFFRTAAAGGESANNGVGVLKGFPCSIGCLCIHMV